MRGSPRERVAALHAARRMLLVAAPAVVVLCVLLWERYAPESGAHLVPLLAAAPAVAVAATGRSTCVLAGGGSALLALHLLSPAGPYHGVAGRTGVLVAILSVFGAGYFAAGRCKRLKRELRRVREVATAAQEALLRPLPPRLEGLTVAAGHVPAVDETAVGGDLYEVVSTPYGVRAVIGDVRGHGLEAVGTVAAVLGSFREAAYDEPRLDGLLRRLERGLVRQQADTGEEFATLQLVEIRADGLATVHNCGHPWPYRLAVPRHGPVGAEPVGEAEPLPPLGLFPLPPRLPAPLRFRLSPGETLFLFTDGAQDARDGQGRYFALRDTLRAALVPGRATAPADLVGTVRAELTRHTGGDFEDDVALLALRNEGFRVPEQAAESAVQERQTAAP